jgi:hypothetical protein
MAKKSIIAVALVATVISPLSAFAQGSADAGSTSTGIGAPAGPRDLEHEAATRGSDEHCYRRKHPSQPCTS